MSKPAVRPSWCETPALVSSDGDASRHHVAKCLSTLHRALRGRFDSSSRASYGRAESWARLGTMVAAYVERVGSTADHASRGQPMDTKPDARGVDTVGDSAVVAVPVTNSAAPSNGNGEPAGKADGLWQSGTEALSRSWDEVRIGWMRLTSWWPGKARRDDASRRAAQRPAPPKGGAD